ncbi:amino acid adenylation domain-containing protein [Phyllobacterium phragmitis]
MKELTPMQAAYWVGRQSRAPLGGVCAHLYAEFDGRDIEAERLQRAVDRLCLAHPMLGLRVGADGRQAVGTPADSPVVEVDDLRHMPQELCENHLAAKRKAWSHQQLDLSSGKAAAFGLSLLPDGASRLHVDTDMIAVDPVSFRIVMEDLARFYENPDMPEETPAPSFFDWLDRLNSEVHLKRRAERDRNWWRDRLAGLPPAPALPLSTAKGAPPPRSDRLAARLSREERDALSRTARRFRLTRSTLMLGLFAITLGRVTGSKRFRLNVPMFWRPPLVDKVERIVGEFSNLLILGIDLAAPDTPAALCERIGAELTELLSHSAYPGVSVMRDLSRLHGSMELSPVVFTAGLDLSGGDLLSERVARLFGAMNWVISQGPQVALDAQVASMDDGMLINWDIRLDALPEGWIREMFEIYVSLVRRVAGEPDFLDASLREILTSKERSGRMPETGEETMKRALTPLQQAYLLGRSEHLPLGGVAMQEFREYRGRIDLAALPKRLLDLVRRHESLRTRIDVRQLVQTVSTEPIVNLETVDLSDLPRAEALRRIDALREDHAHQQLDLDRSPWLVTAFRLPEPDASDPGGDTAVVFLLFDALILDGRAIASLIVELFGGEISPVEGNAPAPLAATQTASRRSRDAAYWAGKLQFFEGAPQLPWKKPLESIKTSRYERQSLVIGRESVTKISRIGARQHLFKNTTLTAVVLEALSRWLNEGALCVGVPVAPEAGGPFANRSTFIAVNWDIRQGSFADRARALQGDILEGLEHLSFSGIDINRLLMNTHPGGPVLPIVITNGLSWPILGKENSVRLHGGLTQTPQVAMDFRFSADGEGNLVLDIDYAREALDCSVIGEILAAIDRLAAAICAAGTLEFSALDILDYGHYRLNGAENDFSSCGFLKRIAGNLFDAPRDKDALVHGSSHISYAALGDRVGRVMASLVARGIGKGSVVAICLPRGPEHTAATLACAFLGAVWVPIDAASPTDRLLHLLDNCRPDLVISSETLKRFETVTPEALLSGEAPADPRALALPLDELSSSEDAAYYLYTSGTTGKPKCVILANKATANVIGRTIEEWGVTDRDVFISVTPLHHDMSVFDVFGCLTAGGTLVLPTREEEKDAIRWNRLVADHGVTLWCSVPAILEMLLSCRRGDELKSLRLVAQGGDYIKPVVIAELRRLAPQIRLISLGGPTETTIWSIWHEIGPDDVDLIPYGRPLPANRYFVLNDLGEHCPAGVVGRIHTAGVNVALGYLENGVLTQHDFVTIADEKGVPVRAFRTGDRGRYRPDGNILFAGRLQGYVKVRGVRVSLPDIENELAKHPSIRQVLVVDYGAEQRGEAAIGALYVAEPHSELSAAELRGFARRHLPESHVPTRFVAVDELPLSANGKPDRRHARQMLISGSDGAIHAGKVAAPVPAKRKAGRVLDIYLGVLGKAGNAAMDESTDFMAIGLLPSHLKKISTRIRDEFGIELTPQQLVRCRNAGQVEQLIPAECR